MPQEVKTRHCVDTKTCASHSTYKEGCLECKAYHIQRCCNTHCICTKYHKCDNNQASVCRMRGEEVPPVILRQLLLLPLLLLWGLVAWPRLRG